MKKLLSAALAMTMLTGLFAFSASAAAPISDVSRMSTEQIAYLDIDWATPDVQEAILEARDEIIHGDQAWTVDGAISMFNPETGETEKLPEFSELFPGWDVPAVEVSASRAALQERLLAAGAARTDFIDENYDVFLTLGSSYAASKSFATVVGSGYDLACYGFTGPVNGRFNLGFSTGGKELGWVPNRTLNPPAEGEKDTRGAKISTKANLVYDIRASASNAASAKDFYTLIVTDNPDVTSRFLFA